VPDYAGLLSKLGELVQEAGRIAQQARTQPKREIKPDGSIVTNGDRLVEQFLRSELTHLIPYSKVWGEEFGHSTQEGNGLWLVDPVDGTTNYSYGSPLWRVSVALLNGANIELGAVVLPDLNETYLCARGNGVLRNGTALKPIPKGKIEDEELVSYSDRINRKFSSIPGKMRYAGAFVIDGCFVATQRYRGLIGEREKLYDVAPCVLFGQELGADVRYANGDPFDLSALTEDRKIGRPWIIFPAESGFLLSGT